MRLAGLLDGRGIVEVGRYDTANRRRVLPDISVEFSVERMLVAKEAARIMGAITKSIRRGETAQAFVRGWKGVSSSADELLPPMKDPTKVGRLETVAKRVKRPHPSVCTEDE